MNENGNGHNQQLEFYSADTDAWTAKEFVGGFAGLPLYAHLFLLADGRIFFSGGRMDDPLDVQPCIFDPSQTPVPTNAVPDLLEPDFRNQSASVLLPPAQDQRVMVIGGGPVGKQDQTDATGAVSIADLTEADPHYLAATPMGLPRLHLNAVLLPDRTVFVSGGSLKQEDQPLARLEGEIYDPATDDWTLTAAATVPRLYHSTAVLLPDGRVVAAGGNPEGGSQVAWIPPDEEEEMRLEVFSPPYLFKGPRPTITAAPTQATYGQTVTIDTPQASTISVGLPRPQRRHHPLLRQRAATGRPPDHRRDGGSHPGSSARQPEPGATRLVHDLPRRHRRRTVGGDLDPARALTRGHR